MGIDTFDLFMEIEEEFSINIPDSEASKMKTVGELFDFVVKHTGETGHSTVCLTAVAFYAVRRAANDLGANKRLRPSDATCSILPDSNQSDYWRSLKELSQLKLPPLSRSNKLVSACSIFVVIGALLTGVWAYMEFNSQTAGFLIAILASVFLGALAKYMTMPFRTCPPRNCESLRTLVEETVARNFHELVERNGGYSKDDVWATLRTLISEQLGVDRDEVVRNANFVNDLGCC